MPEPSRARRLVPPTQVVFALVALAVVVGVGLLFNADGNFFRAYTHSSTLAQIAGYGILSCGLTVVILTGGIDLSVGSLVALSGMVAAMLVREGVSGWVSVGAAVAAAAACGSLSGSLVGLVRLQPFVATLAMMAFARGVAKWVSGGTKVAMTEPPPISALNARFELPATGVQIAGHVPVMLVCVVGTWAFLRLLTAGVQIYAVGDNEQAARYAGVPVARTKILAYTISGALAGLAGVVFAAIERQGNPDGGIGYELTAIAMVVVGGTSLAGGRGGVMPTVLGALTIGYLQKILDINGLETSMQLMITGGIIVLAVLVQGVPARR